MKLSKTAVSELHRFMSSTGYKHAWNALEDAYKTAIYNATTETERLQAANLLTSLEVHRRILEGLNDTSDVEENVTQQLRSVV